MPSTPSHPTQPAFASLVSHDVDEFSAFMPGWDLDFRQLEIGQPKNQVEVIAGLQTFIHKYHFSHSIHQQGTAPDDLLAFGFPSSQRLLDWSGRETTNPVVVNFNAAQGFDCTSKQDFYGMSVSLSKEEISRVAERMDLPLTQFMDRNLGQFLSNKNHVLGEFKRYLYGLWGKMSNIQTPKDLQLAMRALDEKLPVQLLTALSDTNSELCSKPLTLRQKRLRVAVEFIESNCKNTPSIPDICAASDLSWRSLDRAFKERFGIGPKRYLLNLRLIKARRQLKNTPPYSKLADVANEWGFWHMGDFAREYRKMFKELPSETVKR